MPIITCSFCNEKVKALKSTTKYCGDRCRAASSYERSKKLNKPEEVKKGIITDRRIKKAREQHDPDLDKILKNRGLPTLAERKMDAEFVSTGVNELDYMIANNRYDDNGQLLGGFPVRAITEIFGRKGIGKSTLLLKIAPKKIAKVLYIDTEGAVNDLGGAPENVTVVRESAVEVVWGIINDALRDNKYDLIVVDGIAAMTTLKEVADDNDPSGVGLRARLVSNMIRNVEVWLKQSDTALVFTNQQKESFDPFTPKTTMGGTAVAYAASIRLELLSAPSKDKIVREGVKAGHKIRAKLEKSRFGPDGIQTEYKLMFKEL